MNKQAQHAHGDVRTTTIVREEVPCSLSPSGFHMLTVALGNHGGLVHVSSECRSDPTMAETIERLGGACCVAFVDATKAALLNTDTSYRSDDTMRSLPDLARSVVSSAKYADREKRTERQRAREESTDVLTEPLIERVVAMLTRKATAIAGIPLRFSRSEKHGHWRLHVGSYRAGTREVGRRGWQFDEFEIRSHVKGRTDGMFAKNSSGAQAKLEGDNTFCLACKKNVKNRSSHVNTNKHADKIIDGARKAMRFFPGPRKN